MPPVTIDALPAQRGDCLLVSWGTRSMLIDAGPALTFDFLAARLSTLKPKRLDLVVVTHIDDDHIGATFRAFETMEELGIEVGEIWFNGRQHLPSRRRLSALQGERLVTEVLRPRTSIWNAAFQRSAVVVPEGPAPLPEVRLGRAKLTLLSPTEGKLAELRPVWGTELAKHGLLLGAKARAPAAESAGSAPATWADVEALAATKTPVDTSKPNGSSIAFLFEVGATSVLFGADAHVDCLAASLKRLLAQRGLERLPLSLFKVPHHGSRANMSKALLDLVQCREYLITTDGARFSHPHPEAVAKIVRFGGPGVRVYFNYESEFNRVWQRKSLQRACGFEASYPAPGKQGFRWRSDS